MTSYEHFHKQMNQFLVLNVHKQIQKENYLLFSPIMNAVKVRRHPTAVDPAAVVPAQIVIVK